MKCENCGMGFVLTGYNIKRECPHCGHVHGPEAVKPEKEKNMIKNLWKKFIGWLFSWQK